MTNKKREGVLLAASFLLPLALLLTLCALLRLAPFGTGSLVCADARGQYISYFAFYRDLFYGGKDWLYSMGKVLGGSTAGLFAYYLASPFNLLLLLFPGEKLPLAFDWMVLLKLSSCGLSFALYLRGKGRLRPASLLFTAAYALCGYNQAYFWCVMWLDALVALPLVALGIERLLEEDRPLLYLFSLGLAIIACFYTGYMLCLFSLLYFLYRLAVGTPSWRRIPWRRAGRFALASLGAGALSAFVLLPGALALAGGVEISPVGFVRQYTYPTALYVLRFLLPGRDAAFYDRLVVPTLLALALCFLALAAVTVAVCFSRRCRPWVKRCTALLAAALLLGWILTVERNTLRYEMDLAPNLLLGKLSFGGVYFWEMYNGSPNVYVGQLTLLAALGYFFNRAIPARERKLSLLVLCLLVLSLLLYLPNLIWHGFEQNNCFNYRYSFVVCFFLVLLAERSFSSPEGLDWRAVLFPLLFLLAALALTWRDRPYYIDPRLGLPTLLWLLLSAAALLLAKKGRVLPLLAAVQLVALGFSCGLSFYYAGSNGLDTESFAAVYRARRAQFQSLRERDGEPYRVRKTAVLFNYNDPLLFDYRGLVHFSSAEKVRTLDFMRRIGIRINEEYWANGDLGSSRAADALLGARYCLGESFADYAPAGDGFLLNPYALPLAFTASPEAAASLALGADPCQNLNALFESLCPGSEPIFTPLSADCAPGGEEALLLRFTARSEEPVYLYVWSNGFDRLSVRGAAAHELSGLYAPAALYLGSFSPGEAVELALHYSSSPAPVPAVFLYQESGEALAAVTERLRAAPVALRLRSESRLEASLDVSEPSLLVLSLPQEEGWHAIVDGKDAPLETALGLFLALPLEPGVHQIQLRFIPAGLIPGAALSLSVPLLCALWALRRRRRARAA